MYNTDLTLVLPIYWTKTFKTKPDKTLLMSMNWYRNAYHYEQNSAKKYYAELVSSQVVNQKFPDTYKLFISIYYKNPNCDGSNIASIMEKFALDSLQSLDVVKEDNVKHHIGTEWCIAGQDRGNPRCEIIINDYKVINETTDRKKE